MIRKYLGVSAGALLLLLTQPSTARAAEPVPTELQVSGYKLLFVAKATGVQIYKAVAEAGTAPKWVFDAPLAQLVAQHGKLKLFHYDGPSWEAPDGSKLVRDRTVPVKMTAAPHAATDIPWLLAKVVADPAPGVLAHVDYVQRIRTHGGAAPAAAPTRADTKVGVPYTATYAFYVKVD